MVLFFGRHFITRDTLSTTPPSEVSLKAASSSKTITPGGHNSSTTRTGVDTGTSTEATAAPHHSGAIKPVAPTPPYLLLQLERGSRLLFPVSPRFPFTDTGTSTVAAAQALTIPAAAPESPTSTTPKSGEMMPPGESHGWRDDDRDALVAEPRKE